MGACNLIQWDNLGDVHPLPSALKCLIDSASGFDLCVSRNIVAADEEEFGVHKNELRDWNLRRRSIGGASRNGTALRQNLGVRLGSETSLIQVGGMPASSSAFSSTLRICCQCSCVIRVWQGGSSEVFQQHHVVSVHSLREGERPAIRGRQDGGYPGASHGHFLQDSGRAGCINRKKRNR